MIQIIFTVADDVRFNAKIGNRQCFSPVIEFDKADNCPSHLAHWDENFDPNRPVLDAVEPTLLSYLFIDRVLI